LDGSGERKLVSQVGSLLSVEFPEDMELFPLYNGGYPL